jgi:hypothetical protein
MSIDFWLIKHIQQDASYESLRGVTHSAIIETYHFAHQNEQILHLGVKK